MKNIISGLVSNATVTFTYTPAVRITSFSNNVQLLDSSYTPVKIYGQGFQAPVAVSLAGWAAYVQSVSSTEIDVLPGNALPTGCSDITGPIAVTNIDTGDSATGGSFTYVVPKPAITGITPSNSCPGGAPCPNNGTGGIPATISGVFLPCLGRIRGREDRRADGLRHDGHRRLDRRHGAGHRHRRPDVHRARTSRARRSWCRRSTSSSPTG